MRRGKSREASTILALILFFFVGGADATPIRIDLPAIGSAGLGDFNVVGNSKDDTLLWVSDAIAVDGKATTDRFRLWSLESDTYYALSFGATNEAPGRIVGFCGYTGGLNNALYDPENGTSAWANLEQKGTKEVSYGGVRWSIAYDAGQGEFKDIFEEFDFSFSASLDKLMVRHEAEGAKDHPFDYVSDKTLFGKDATIEKFLAALQKDDHKWNAKEKPFTVTCLDEVAPGIAAATCPSEVPEAVFALASEQPGSVPEPNTLWLLCTAAFALRVTCAGKGVLRRRGAL